MEANYKMLQCGSGLIRYIQDKEDGQLWFALADIFNALQLPSRLRNSSIFEDREITKKMFYHTKLRKPQMLTSVTQSGLLKIIWKSDDIIFRAFKTWLADRVLEEMYGTDYVLRLMPYIQNAYDPNTLVLSVAKQELPLEDKEN